jgi:GNAT superfamily N-acetyltransferase
MVGAMALTVRPAVPADAELILGFIRELADYEQLSHEAVATRVDIAAALFDPPPKVFCEIAEEDGAPVGFALWFYNFSTFQGRAGLYLEDLYVRPAARRAGVGGALLQHLARRCVDEGLGRLCWSVLAWNRPAIDFYEGLGARLTEDWVGCRLEGAALAALGKAR